MSRQTRYYRLYSLLGSLVFCLMVVGCGTYATAGGTPAEWHFSGPALATKAAGQRAMSTPTATPLPLVIPQRLVVPSIGVDASVEQVGIQASGDLQTPVKNPWVDTGWYNGGPPPGQRGSAVIDGHLDRPGGFPAVFWFLRNLKTGAEVQVIESNGQTVRFRVTDIEYYQPQNAPLQQIFGNNGGTYLNLITCAGDWIPSQKQTTLRLVVYTTLE